MTPGAIEPTRTERPLSSGARLGLVPTTVALFFLGVAAVMAGHRLAKSAVVDIGPTDEAYAQGFRDMEREGSTYFRWSSVPSSAVWIPLRSCGPGTLRLRLRRHFVDPATLSVSLGGIVLGQRSVTAREDHPYDVLEFPYSKMSCDNKAHVVLETIVGNRRPLGVALDWLEIRSPSGFLAAPDTMALGGALMGLSGLALLIAGGGPTLILGCGAALSALLASAFAANPVAAERILKGGFFGLILTLAVGAGVAQLTGVLKLPVRQRVALTSVVLFTLLSRVAFLHPGSFYPDYRVHALVQETLNRLGISTFLDHLFEIQYARSLGLQQIAGNWYPFPYPPGSYVLTGGAETLFGLTPLDASLITAAVLAALIPLLTMALSLALGFGAEAGLAAAFYVSLQPLLVRRMALGYFPGLAGQFADGIALLLFVDLVRASRWHWRQMTSLTAALVAAFLVYTQSIANFGLLIAGVLFLELMRPSPGGRKASLRAAVAGGLALIAATGLFYFRYAPVFENAAQHRPQPESHVLDRLEELRATPGADREIVEADDLNDPWSGTTLNPARGVGRLASRLWRFNGPFVFAVVIGGWMLLRRSDPLVRNLLLSWGGVSLWISLLAAGLPSPNGFQHLKDLEFVSPLIALGVGVLTLRLWEWRPVAGGLLASAWAVYAGTALAEEWNARLLVLIDR